jgi:hypothetical protein
LVFFDLLLCTLFYLLEWSHFLVFDYHLIFTTRLRF